MNWDWEKLQQKQKDRSTGGGGVKPPQMDELVDKFKEFKFPGGWLLLILAGVILFFGTSMVYTVDVNEVGVVQRFGKYIRTEMPGLNFKLPAGIERVTKVKTKRVYKEEFGFTSRQSETSRYSSSRENIDESLMLTGDLNVGVVPWIVQYRIKDPYQYLFKVRDVTQFLRDMSEASMRLVVGDRSINEVISNREEIAAEAQAWLQKELDEAETGIDIDTVELGNTNVPVPVQDSFNKVNQAVQEKEKLIYQAREEYNRVIPRARGEAEQTIKSAEGYATERVNEAKGDAARFISQYEEYAKAKDVTRRRLYLEMVNLVFPELGELYIIDSDQTNVLPLLNLGEKWGLQK
ncbi:MAG: FtsH protease activity modulator HflK [Desulfobacteraceae bacterium]|nr:FtsH protease activity modulator HflK [Desulfobacteraceae bacterium]MBC2754151.1 FtsH protease activity modulator HflK [Desulfobacteraceae bacterium]